MPDRDGRSVSIDTLHYISIDIIFRLFPFHVTFVTLCVPVCWKKEKMSRGEPCFFFVRASIDSQPELNLDQYLVNTLWSLDYG